MFVHPLFHSLKQSFVYLLVRSFAGLFLMSLFCNNSDSTDVRVGFCFEKFDDDGCTNPKGREMRKSVCCCTMGAGWGDPCELCPQKNTCKYIAMFIMPVFNFASYKKSFLFCGQLQIQIVRLFGRAELP